MPKDMLYLGVPLHFGRKKYEVFTFLIDRIHKKINGWFEKYLSKAGELVMVKAMVLSIPTYAMSCLSFPK